MACALSGKTVPLYKGQNYGSVEDKGFGVSKNDFDGFNSKLHPKSQAYLGQVL